MKIKIGIYGASGKMGRNIAKLAQASNLYELTAVVVDSEDEIRGKPLSQLSTDLPSLPLCTNNLTAALSQVEVMIDFSSPEATLLLLKEAVKHKAALVIGTTGLTLKHEDAMQQASKIIPLVYSANMSVGINTLLAILPQLSQALPNWEVEILELHHRDKKDAPSGTALALAKTIRPGEQIIKGRTNDSPRKTAQELAISTLRGGDVAGEHTVFFFSDGERLELTHRANDREIFAQGALRAAQWVIRQPAGLYGMKNVLGF